MVPYGSVVRDKMAAVEFETNIRLVASLGNFRQR